MHEYNLESWYVDIMLANIRNRVFNINGNSKYYPLSRGICQGSAAGPLIFSLYIKSKIMNCNYLIYADDITIYAEGTSLNEINDKLSSQMESIQKWSVENKISINYSKTKCMYFHKSKDTTIKKENVNGVQSGEHFIERVYQFKYLGLTLDPNLTFKIHFDNVLSKVTNKIKYSRSFKRFLLATF